MGVVPLVLLDVALVVVLSRLLAAGLARVSQPRVMGEVLAGLVLGAAVLGALDADASSWLFTADVRPVLTRLGQVGLAAYLFTVGTRLALGRLRAQRREVGRVAVASFAVPWVAGLALAPALHGSVAGDPPLGAFVLFLGTALAVTAFPVLARIVDARGLQDAPAGRVALAAAGAQELLVWPTLAVAVALGSDGAGRGPGELLVLGGGAVALVLVLARLVVPRAGARSAGPVALVALGISAAAMEWSGLHLVLGAVLFGAALPAAPREAALSILGRRPARALTAVLLPLAFAVPALKVDPASLGLDGLGTLALVLVVAVAGKLLSAAWAARSAGMGRPDALRVGVLMNARGLVELVVLSVGLDAGLLDERLFSVLVLMALITTFATGPGLSWLDRVRRAPDTLEPDPPGRPRAEPETAGAS